MYTVCMASLLLLFLSAHAFLFLAQVSQVVSRELEKECIVVFDEAHNIDNVCIEALSVNLRKQTLDTANRNITRLTQSITRARQANASKLQQEYQRLVQGLVAQVGTAFWANKELGQKRCMPLFSSGFIISPSAA